MRASRFLHAKDFPTPLPLASFSVTRLLLLSAPSVVPIDLEHPLLHVFPF